MAAERALPLRSADRGLARRNLNSPLRLDAGAAERLKSIAQTIFGSGTSPRHGDAVLAASAPLRIRDLSLAQRA